MRKEEMVHEAVNKVVPIYGISFVKIEDPSTWIIHFVSEPTVALKAEAYKTMWEWKPPAGPAPGKPSVLS